MTEAVGTTWIAEYGEVSEIQAFRVSYRGTSSASTYFPLAQLADLISVLTAADGASVGSVSYGSHLLSKVSSTGFRAEISVAPVTPGAVPLLALDAGLVSDLINVLTALQGQIPASSPQDWDDTKPNDLPDALLSQIAASPQLNTAYVRAIIVDKYRQGSDPDDTLSFVRAVAAAIADTDGPRVILAPSPAYSVSSQIDLAGLYNCRISGSGIRSTMITINGGGAAVNGWFMNSGSCGQIEFCDMTLAGTVVDDVDETVPRRSRTTSGGAGVNSAILLRGDRHNLTGYGTVTDIALRRMRFERTNALPFVFDGVKGYAEANDVEMYLTMDGSWLYCDHVVFDAVRSRKSADNGISVSRSNKKVTGGSLHVSGCFDYGLFVSGFVVDGDENDAGPIDFSIDTINVVNAGQGGVKLDDAPRNGRIGNIYVHTVYRGGSDIPTDSGGIGVLIGGNPATPTRATTPDVVAGPLSIGNVMLIDCHRGGVLVSGGASNVTIDDITVVNPGSQYLADGVTAISTGDRNNNFGIAVALSFVASVSNILVRNAYVIDTRGTAYGNRAIDLAGATGSGHLNLRSSGMRVTVYDDNLDQSIDSVKTFRKRPAAEAPSCTITPGSAAATAVAAGNGANDMAGTVSITASASPTNGPMANVTFGGTYSATPHVVITPTNSASADCVLFLSSRSSTGFTVAARVAPAASAALQFDYHVFT